MKNFKARSMQSSRHPADDKSLQPIVSQLSLTPHFSRYARQLVSKWSVLEPENVFVRRNLLKGLVGACGFEPQPPTVSRQRFTLMNHNNKGPFRSFPFLSDQLPDRLLCG